MNNFDWSIMKARKRMRQRKDRSVIRGLKKAAVTVAIGATAALSLGFADEGKNYELVEEIYTVQRGDTLWTIGEEYVAKNTHGSRYLLEFIEGIKQNNSALVKSHGQVEPGQKLRITYWVKK